MATLAELIAGQHAAGLRLRAVVEAAGGEEIRDPVMGDLLVATVPVSRGNLVLVPAEAIPEDPGPLLSSLLDRGALGLVVREARAGGGRALDAAAARRGKGALERVAARAPAGLAVLSVPPGTPWHRVVVAVEAGRLGAANGTTLIREWLLSLALNGSGTHPFLEQLRCFFEAPVAFLDNDLRLADCSGRVRYQAGLGRLEGALLRVPRPEGGGVLLTDPRGIVARLEPIEHQGRRLGYLTFVGGREPHPEEEDALRQAAAVYGWQCHVEARSTAWRRHGRGRAITRMMIDRAAGPHDARVWAAALGVFLDAWQVALAVLPGEPSDANAFGPAIERAAAREGLRAFWDELPGGLWAAVLDLPTGMDVAGVDAAAGRVAADLRQGLATRRTASGIGSATVGLGNPVRNAESLHASFAQARRVARLGRRIKGPGVYRADDLGPVGLLALAAPGPLRAAAGRILGHIDAADDTGAPELHATLQAFVAADGDRRRAAEALHVHPNTVSYRLQRIAQVTALDPLRLGDLLQLQLALLAADLPAED